MRKNIRKKVFLNFAEKSKYARGYCIICISEAFPCGVFWWNADDLLIYCTLYSMYVYQHIPHTSNILYWNTQKFICSFIMVLADNRRYSSIYLYGRPLAGCWGMEPRWMPFQKASFTREISDKHYFFSTFSPYQCDHKNPLAKHIKIWKTSSGSCLEPRTIN